LPIPALEFPKNFFTKLFTSLFFHGTIQLSTTDTDLENKMKIVMGCLAVCLVALVAVFIEQGEDIIITREGKYDSRA
jgi:hypothetical protein